jgi:hypothetical protein
MDKIKTATGRRLRQEGLRETTLPIPYDPAAMPGAVVLATDGQAYKSLKHGATYQWRKQIAATPNGEVLVGTETPRSNFMIYPGSASERTLTPGLQSEGSGESKGSASITRVENSNDPVRFFLAKDRSGALQNNDAVAVLHFAGSDGAGNAMTGAEIFVRVEGTPSAKNVPMNIRLNTLPASAGAASPLERVMITADGLVLINNTSGTERLSVFGNVRIMGSGNGLMVGADKVVASRRTGWAAPTGTATRSAFDTSSATVGQLAERLKALIDDLTAHGLIGA